MHGRRPTRWTRWRTVLLVVLLLLPGTPEVLSRIYAENAMRDGALAALAPGRNTLPDRGDRHQAAPPAPSGAYPPYPPNHTFDAEVVTLPGSPANFDFETPGYGVGTPPTNADFATAPNAVGTPPTNFDFATGDFTGWSTGGATIQSDATQGSYAELAANGASVTTAAFTVDAGAQAFTFRLNFTGAGGGTVNLNVLTGTGYGTSSGLGSPSCGGGSCAGWTLWAVDAAPYRGQSVKFRLTRAGGTVGVDEVQAGIAYAGFAMGGLTSRRTDGANAYVRLDDGNVTTEAFAVDAAAQFATMRLRAETGGTTQFIAYVLSGSGYATSTLVASGSLTTAWETRHFNLKDWQGQSIKLKVREWLGAVGLDDVGVQRVDFPGWTIATDALPAADGQGGTALQINGDLTSAAFALPQGVQQLSFRYRASDPNGTGLYPKLLRGPTFATTTALSGGPVGGPIGVWQTYTANVAAYAGETVKLRFSPQLQAVYVDAAGVLEQAVPGWSLVPTSGAVAPGADAHGSYVAGVGGTGGIELRSGPVDAGYVDTAAVGDGRSYVVTYALGTGTAALVRVWWVTPTAGWLLYTDASDTADGVTVTNGRFAVSDTTGPHGYFQVQITNGGKLYSLGDNVARQQLAEPFSQQAGAGIDTSTGSFGTSETDLAVQGGPLPLAFTRYYRGHSDRSGSLGYRWSHTYDTFLGIYGNDVAVVFGSGREEVFHQSGGAFHPLDVRVKGTLTEYTNPPDGVDYRYVTKDKLTYAFEGDGDLISVVDPNGNQITVYRDPTTERITSVEDPGGRTLDLTYDANGRLETVTGPDGAQVTYTYDANGDLVAVDKPEDARTEYAYSRHRLTEVKQRQGEDLGSSSMVTVLTNTLDDVNRVVAQTDSADHSVEIAYLTGTQQGITRVTDQLDEDTDFYFDDHARTFYIDHPGDPIDIFVYDAVGNLQKMVDAADHETQFAYDANADVTTLTDPLGNPSNITYNAQILPELFTDANGHDWSFSYDVKGNVLTKTNPLGKTWTYTYDAAGNRLTETTPLDRTWTYTYDDDNNLESKTDPLDHSWTYTYAVRGMKLTETDPNNHTTTWNWDFSDRISSMEDAAGETWSYSYNLLGEMITTTDPAGETTIWLYLGAIGLVYGRTDVLDNTWLYEYDDAGRMTLATDPLGHATAYAYDANGRLTSQTVDPNSTGETDHLSIVTTYDYDETGRLVAETLDPGSSPHLDRTTSYVYDDAGRLVGKELPNGGVWTYGYDDVGNQTSVTDPLDRTTTYTYDIADRLVLETDPLGNGVKYVYDDDNRQTQVVVDPATDPDGDPYAGSHLDLTTTTAYDAADRITSITDPAGTVTAYGYDDAGNQTSVTVDPGSAPHLNETTTYNYDELNRVVAITDPLGRSTTYAYDSRGRKTSETRGATLTESGITTAYTYDDLGRLLSITLDPGTSPHLNNVTSFTYDDAGRRLTMTNPRGKTTHYAYDAADRLTEIEDALSGTVSFAYNAAGETTQLTNPRGKTTTYTYDDLGNVLTETDPLAREHEYVYDLAGQLTQETDARDVETNYLYDLAGRLTNVQDDAEVDLITYGYDAASRQTGMTDETGSTGWIYDDADRITSVTSPQGTIGYAYDAAGRRTTMTLPGSKTVSYAYDAAGQLTGVTDWQSRTTTISYTGFGAVLGVVRPNGVESGYEYDTGGRLTAVEHADGATLLARFSYSLDPNDNRTALTSTGTAVTNQTETYTYDELDRLTEAAYDDGTNPVETIEYAYDATGNRLTVTSGANVTNYTYDDADQLSSLSGATSLSFTYDLNGNRVAAGSDSFSYDWRNRLVEADVDSTTVEYTYTGDDLRATRRANGGTATPYLWDREQGLPEIVSDGTVAYVQLDDPGLVAEIDAGNDDAYPLPDALGTARLRTDDTGAVDGTADYDAFGNARSTSGTQTALDWDGELRDPATGLTYLRARDVDPRTGRFLQQDTVQPNAPGTQGYNRYAFAADNPVTRTDPSGHDIELALQLQAIASLYDAYQGAVAIVRHINKLPPIARGLVAAVLGFAIGVLRTVIAMLVMNLVIDTAGVLVKNTMIGRALTLLQQSRIFQGAKEAIENCAAKSQICKLLPELLPKLPCVAAAVAAQRAADELLGVETTTLDYAGAAIMGLEACRNRGPGKGGEPDKGGTCAPNSFDGATPVLMADGGTKRIDEVAIGDMVLASDPTSGESGPREVTGLIMGDGKKDLVNVTVATERDRETITATAGHPFWVASVGMWLAAASLVVGMALATPDGTAMVTATRSYTEPHRVYNLTIEELHTYYIEAGSIFILVHNDLCGTNERGKTTSRTRFRNKTLQDAWDQAEPGPTGGRSCPTCGRETFGDPYAGEPRDWDGSHNPSWTNRTFPDDVTRREVTQNYQEGVSLECRTCNRSGKNKRW